MPMALGIASCSDTIDNPAVVPVVDEKPFANGQYVDESVRPGDNFYEYAFGKWLKDEDPDKPCTDQAKQLLDESSQNMMESASDPVLDALRSLIGQAMTDDKADMQMLVDRAKRIENIKSQEELLSIFSELQQLGYQPLLRLGTSTEDATVKGILSIGYVSSALKELMSAPDNEEVVAEIVRLRCDYLKVLGYSEERIAEVAEHAASVELMEYQAFTEDIDLLRKPRTAKTRAVKRSANLTTLYQLMGISLPEELMMENPKPEKQAVINQLVGLLMEGSEESILTVRDYMLYHFVSQDLCFIPSKINNAEADLLTYAIEPAKYYSYRLAAESFGLDNIYQEECNDILEEFRDMLDKRIQELNWMSESTKQEARKKLRAMKFYIGYPEKWNDAFTPKVEGGTLLQAVINMRQQALRFTEQIVGTDMHQNGWDYLATLMPFALPNAMHIETANTLIILPCFLVSPVFDPSQSDASLYGAATVFGHELCHGFDANGAKYDERGVLRDWWTATDNAAFQAKQSELVKLYNQLDAYPGQKANGEMTLDENMADYAGVTLGLECYKQRITQQGFTSENYDEQLRKFWLSYAALWQDERELYPEALVEQYLTDEHSAAHNRINGIVRLFDEWYRLYDVQSSDALYLNPEERVKIW